MTQMVDALFWDFKGPCIADSDPSIIVAAYVNHPDNPDSLAQAQARFPNNQIVTINSHADADADILDVENGAVSPSDKAKIVGWVTQVRNTHVNPTIYMNTSTWPLIRSYFPTDAPMWWVAHWDDIADVPPGADGKQYTGDPGYDLSIMLDKWFPSITNKKGDDMPLYYVSDGQGHTYVTDTITIARHVEGDGVPWAQDQISKGNLIDCTSGANAYPNDMLQALLSSPVAPSSGKVTGDLTISYGQ